jgi:filamentous hemagglutinin
MRAIAEHPGDVAGGVIDNCSADLVRCATSLAVPAGLGKLKAISTLGRIDRGLTEVNLAERANKVQSALPARTANSTATAVLRAADRSGTQQLIVGTSEQTFRSSWLSALAPGEIGVAGPDDAELNALAFAQNQGWTAVEVAASRPICAGCQMTLRGAGVTMSSPLKEYPGIGWLLDLVRGGY